MQVVVYPRLQAYSRSQRYVSIVLFNLMMYLTHFLLIVILVLEMFSFEEKNWFADGDHNNCAPVTF